MITRSTKPPIVAGYDPSLSADGCTYDDIAAEKPITFFRSMRHIKGPLAGKPLVLQTWQEDIWRTLIGWKRPDGYRRYRTAFIFVPRKNGKSTMLAGIGNYILYCDSEGGAECYCAASNREQASLVFNLSASMIRKNAKLDKLSKIRDSVKRIIYKDSFFHAIPANEGGAHGYNAHLIIGDELHAWPGRDFYDVLHTSTGARSQPLEVYITTAGWDRHSICYEVYQYAKQVRDGKIDDPQFLPVIFEAEQEDDWTDPKIWQKANPNLGISISREYLERECKKAIENQRYENTFRRLHLNQWTSQETRWLSMEDWRRCAVGEEIDDGAEVYGGLDLSSTKDVTAWVIAERRGKGYRLKGHYFIPEATLREAERRDRVPYSQWIRAGLVTATPGNAVDYSYVHSRILADCDRHKMRMIGYDPWHAQATANHLEDAGCEVLKIRQGFSDMSEPCKEMEKCVLSGTLDHGGDPVLEWMADNVQVKELDGNVRLIKPDAQNHDSGKRIDGIVAAVMSIATAMAVPPEGTIDYEPGGLFV